ncbi:hypothetical protein K449DRAFT_440502 [Hypoxylon sp. EC38]|nr:hypothetical protein K449DRAFT_440502 [Hypoxylon sp. EC38]
MSLKETEEEQRATWIFQLFLPTYTPRVLLYVHDLLLFPIYSFSYIVLADYKIGYCNTLNSNGRFRSSIAWASSSILHVLTRPVNEAARVCSGGASRLASDEAASFKGARAGMPPRISIIDGSKSSIMWHSATYNGDNGQLDASSSPLQCPVCMFISFRDYESFGKPHEGPAGHFDR